MAISDADVADVLSKCARHCCICRRFKPLHLHVHHIKEKAEGGSDDIDNLIATCMTCHSDIHTQTKLTRRFTARELVLHREAVYKLVSEGKLPAPEVPDAGQRAYEAAMQDVGQLSQSSSLLPESVELLLAVVKAPIAEDGEPPLIAMHKDHPFFIRVGRDDFGAGDPRKAARYKRAFELLIQRGYVEHAGGVTYQLTDDGWILGDELLAGLPKSDS